MLTKQPSVSPVSRFAILVVAATLAISGIARPAEAAKAKKKKSKATTTLRAVLPPPVESPTTLAPILPPVEAPTGGVQPTTNPQVQTLSPEQMIRASYDRMFAPRDKWIFAEDLRLNKAAADLRANINKQLGAPVWIAEGARFMKTTPDNLTVAIINGLVADARISPAILQKTVVSATVGLADIKVLRVNGGIAIAGTDDGEGVALVAFENFYIEVFAVDRQRAQDAAFVVATNMGHQLTE